MVQGNATLIVVKDWQDHPVTREVYGHAMLMISPGVWYHVRLDLYIMITKDTKHFG